jgi:hypothetical protein
LGTLVGMFFYYQTFKIRHLILAKKWETDIAFSWPSFYWSQTLYWCFCRSICFWPLWTVLKCMGIGNHSKMDFMLACRPGLLRLFIFNCIKILIL